VTPAPPPPFFLHTNKKRKSTVFFFLGRRMGGGPLCPFPFPFLPPMSETADWLPFPPFYTELDKVKRLLLFFSTSFLFFFLPKKTRLSSPLLFLPRELKEWIASPFFFPNREIWRSSSFFPPPPSILAELSQKLGSPL